MSRRTLPFAALCVAALGCSETETELSPLDAGAAGADAAGADAAADGSAGASGGARVRTVERRNPLGRTAEHNLLVDGDFELSGGYGQFGWRAVSSGGGQTGLRHETGGLCRSGVSCGVLASDQSLLALGAAAADHALSVTLYTKPPVADCGLTQVSLINCTTYVLSTVAQILPERLEPDPDGWCKHHAVAPPMAQQPCLLLASFAGPDQITLVDEASILRADGAASPSTSATAPSAEELERIQAAVRVVTDTPALPALPPAKLP
jgi:hypothetical protein